MESQANPIILNHYQILYAPDFVLNIGGAMAAIGQKRMAWSPDEARSRVVQSVQDNLSLIFEQALAEGISTNTAALRLAESRLI